MAHWAQGILKHLGKTSVELAGKKKLELRRKVRFSIGDRSH